MKFDPHRAGVSSHSASEGVEADLRVGALVVMSGSGSDLGWVARESFLASDGGQTSPSDCGGR
jgi:hypothetical protein